MTTASSSLDDQRRRALYRASHRGTREMDWLLGRFAAAELAAMDAGQLAAFERLLQLPDPDLNRWILDPAGVVDEETGALIGDIRTFHGIGAP